jgi:hypothetical protein
MRLVTDGVWQLWGLVPHLINVYLAEWRAEPRKGPGEVQRH